MTSVNKSFQGLITATATACTRLAAIDHRSLAAFRVLVAIVVLSDLGLRVRDFTDHYTDGGVVPYRILGQVDPSQCLAISLFSLSTVDGMAWFAFSLCALAAIGLLFGRHHRLCAIACLVALVSLQRRNPFIFNGGDTLLRMLLVWILLLPNPVRWPISRTIRTVVEGAPRETFSAASFGLLVQLCLVYWVSAMAKGHGMWRGEATAIEHTLRLESFRTPIASWAAPWLLQHPSLLSAATSCTLWLEEAGPMLILFSRARPILRCTAVAIFWIFHLGGIAALINIGVFPFVCAAAWVAFLPGQFWEWLQAWTCRPAIVSPRDNSKESDVLPGHSHPIRIDNRDKTWILNVISGSITAYVVIYNVGMFNPPAHPKNPPHWFWMIGKISGLAQNWQLFAPYVNTRDGWFVGVLKRSDGQTVDPIRGQSAVSWLKPPRIASEYKTKRWRRFLLNLYHERTPKLIESYASYVTRKYNASHPEAQVASLEIYFMLQDSMHPEDGVTRVRIFPIMKLDDDGKAVFEGDNRRNTELNSPSNPAAR